MGGDTGDFIGTLAMEAKHLKSGGKMLASFILEGGRALKGTVKIDSAKNAVLPVIAAALLTRSKCVIEEAPNSRTSK